MKEGGPIQAARPRSQEEGWFPVAQQEGTAVADEEGDATSLRELVRRRLAVAGADPRDVVDDLHESIADEHRDHAAYVGLTQIVGEEVRRYRRKAMRPAPPPRRPRRSKKWQRAAAVAEERPDVFAARLIVGYEANGAARYEFLRDCDAAMLAAAAELCRAQADGMHTEADALQRRAEQYDALAAKVPEGGKVDVLPRETVEAIFDD
jgi:hypothetical protein